MRRQDFRTKIGSTVFGVRATALIVKDNRLFVIEDEDGCYTIGGAIQVNETTEDAVVREVKEELGVEPAKVDPLGLLKLLAEHVVFVPEDHVLLEFFDGHGVDHLVRQVHEAVAVVTDLFPADLPGQQALDLPAANGAGRAFCK